MYTITKEFDFCAAHRLSQLPDNHKCSKVHGHNYKVKVSLTVDSLNSQDFVIDFGELKIIQEWLNKSFDHKILVFDQDEKLKKLVDDNPEIFNAIIISFNPTCEKLAEYFATNIYTFFEGKIQGLQAVQVEVYETEGNSATYIILSDRKVFENGQDEIQDKVEVTE